MQEEHIPVLLNETLELLSLGIGEKVVDCTVDGGGHAAAMAQIIGTSGRLVGLDWDQDLADYATKKFSKTPQVSIVHSTYTKVADVLKSENFGKADGLIADLGFSSWQLLGGGGFSFEKDEPLLMTYDKDEPPAAKLINELLEKDLADMIFTFGGERKSRLIAKAIVFERRRERILTTGRLVQIVSKAVGGGYERGRINPATRTFQALRIAANRELENVEKLMSDLPGVMNKGGRVAIITFHSLEDAIVKKSFAEMEKNGLGKRNPKKPVSPTHSECRKNPRSRSAKLRGFIFNK